MISFHVIDKNTPDGIRRMAPNAKSYGVAKISNVSTEAYSLARSISNTLMGNIATNETVVDGQFIDEEAGQEYMLVFLQ